ncbi:hypothetical protein BLSTO_05004 [Blastocystis sp. subtype 1]
MVSSLSQSLLHIELLFLDCQGDFSALPSGSLPLAERMEDLQNRLSFLTASSNAVESRMKAVTEEFAATLSRKEYVLSHVTQQETSMAGVMEKVCAAEPVVSAAPKLKEELEGYKELLAQSGLLRERVKMMSTRQEELEHLLDETGTLVAQVRSSMRQEIPQIIQLLDQLSSTLLRGIRCFSSRIEEKIFYSPAQAIRSVLNVTYPSTTKKCNVTIQFNSNVPRSTLEISGELKFPYSIEGAHNVTVVSDTLKKGDIKQPSVTLLTSDLLLKEVKANVFDTSALFATPEVVEKLIPIAPILGPRRLMPSTKNGTVSEDIAEAIRRFYQPTVAYEISERLTIEQCLGIVVHCTECEERTLPPRSLSLYRDVFISSGTSARYSIDRQFLVPGKRFFNESISDSTLPIPPKHIKAEKARNKVISAIFDDVPPSEEPVAPPTQEEDDSW